MKYRGIVLAAIIVLSGVPALSAQNIADPNLGSAAGETELVIEDFSTTGLGDSTSFGISLGGLIGGSAALDINFDIFVSPLVGLRLGFGAALPLLSSAAGSEVSSLGLEMGLGAIWRSYVINRTRFYGGVILKGAFDIVRDQDLLLVPEGFGGFEVFASPSVSIFSEFGGRSSIPIISFNASSLASSYTYVDGFFFRVGTRFDL